MYIHEISIEIKSNVNKGELCDEFDLLAAYYRGSGQTQGRVESQFIDKNKIVCLPYTLERNSLNKKYNNFYVNRQSKLIEELCVSKLKIKLVGKSHYNYRGTCKCIKSSFFILITNYTSIDSVITCGDCNKSIPLYKLPIYSDYGYMDVLRWESNYISCDRLQMNCEVGEKWAMNQMQKVDSALSNQGMKICEKITSLTNIPTYYYLYNYRNKRFEKGNKHCPVCNSNWSVKRILLNTYDYKCDKCKIISNISPNSA